MAQSVYFATNERRDLMKNDFNKPYIIENGNYCGKKGVVFYGTKTQGPRGDYYKIIILCDNKEIAFGDEQGNYAGGIYSVGNNFDHLVYTLHHDLSLREMFVDYLKNKTENTDWKEMKEYLKNKELYY